jgi:hypothetical protein
LAIAEFIELTLLRAQNATEVMGRVAINCGGVAGELFNEKSSPHVQILSQHVIDHTQTKSLRSRKRT